MVRCSERLDCLFGVLMLAFISTYMVEIGSIKR